MWCFEEAETFPTTERAGSKIVVLRVVEVNIRIELIMTVSPSLSYPVMQSLARCTTNEREEGVPIRAFLGPLMRAMLPNVSARASEQTPNNFLGFISAGRERLATFYGLSLFSKLI